MPSVLITGASRGLGLEFVRQYLADGWTVHACARKPEGELKKLAEKYPSLTLHALDVTDHAAVDALAKELKDLKLDVLINNAGIYGPPRDSHAQSLAGIDYITWRKTFETNSIAPYKITQAFVPHLLRGAKKGVVMISSQVGSMSIMKESGRINTIYQSSKAALNMASISLSHDLKPQGIGVLIFHPGWVKTDMGGTAAPIEAPESVAGMRKVIEGFTLADTASYLDYQGKKLAW